MHLSLPTGAPLLQEFAWLKLVWVAGGACSAARGASSRQSKQEQPGQNGPISNKSEKQSQCGRVAWRAVRRISQRRGAQPNARACTCARWGYACPAAGASPSAPAGSGRYQPRSFARPTRREKRSMDARVGASPSMTSLVLARVMATLMRRQSASSLPAGGGGAQAALSGWRQRRG